MLFLTVYTQAGGTQHPGIASVRSTCATLLAPALPIFFFAVFGVTAILDVSAGWIPAPTGPRAPYAMARMLAVVSQAARHDPFFEYRRAIFWVTCRAVQWHRPPSGTLPLPLVTQ